MGARSAENFLIYQLIFLNKFFLCVEKNYASIQFKKHLAAMRFILVKLLFSARSPPISKNIGPRCILLL